MTNEDYPFGLEAMFASTNVTVADIQTGHLSDINQLSRMDKLTTTSTFAALLATPQLQANAYRLEALVHIAVATSAGRQHLTSEFVRKVFKRFGNGICGRLEDPAEDLFTTVVHSNNGNFLVFEGLREGNGFYLQRVLDVLEDIPDRGPFARMRRSVFALLALSDAVAKRAGLVHGMVGEPQPHSDIPREMLTQLNEMRKWVRFNGRDLEQMGVDVRDLSPFIFQPRGSRLEEEPLTDSSLQRHPVLLFGDIICLALPTSVGTAITRYVVSTVALSGNLKVFETTLAMKYWELLSWTPFVDKREPPPFQPREESGLWVGSTLHQVDPGRHVHLVVLIQPLNESEDEGEEFAYAASIELSHLAMEEIRQAAQQARTESGFREGISLVVSCGLGESSIFVGEEPPSQWEVEFIPIHDAITMGWMEGFKPIDLFRMANSEYAVAAAGIRLVNVNGLLNLWAWANDLNGHLIPHGQLPESFRTTDAPRMIVVRQNGLLKLRQEVYERSHTLAAETPDELWSRVRRLCESVFEDDLQAPLYVEEKALRTGSLATVYISPLCHWWIDISSTSSNRGELFEHWRMLCSWLIRFVPPVESAFGGPLPSSLKLRIHFEKLIDVGTLPIQIPNSTELRNAFRINVDDARHTINITVGGAFDSALASPDNIAEEALVAAMIRGFSMLEGWILDYSTESALLAQICPSRHARSRHIMAAQNFRDMIQFGVGNPIRIHLMDDAAARVGIAFRVQADVGAEILGRKECTAFLNKAATLTLHELCTQLQSFNRRHFIEEVLKCHEEAVISRDHWRRTAHANIALHGDAAVHAVAEHMAEMTACRIATRILIEAAVCECPRDGGFRPGELDISRAMARAIFAFQMGGWSDAIHWGAISAKVRVTPIGDIHVDHTFMDTVYSPFTHAGGKREVLDAVDSYEDVYNELKPVKSITDVFERQFLDAWEEEFGVSLDILRKFADKLEDLGVELKALWFELSRSELLIILAECAGREPPDVTSTIDRLILPVRGHWRETPEGFRDKDWHPWRFRRRLSLVRRPLIALDGNHDPRLLVAPAVVRDALYILLRSYHTGETPDWQVSSRPMLKWLGHTNNVTRTAFNESVASQLRDLGWKSASDYKISRLLGIPLDRDYGDVDALAWDPKSGRVLAIECKDLHFHKTLGEVAEQLSDFRGETKPDGKRDLLRKHLDRIITMESHKSAIRKLLALEEDPQIEAYVVFKNPVPMEFSWPKTMPTVQPLLASQLGTLRLTTAPESRSSNEEAVQ
jgi:hypothetical protein